MGEHSGTEKSAGARVVDVAKWVFVNRRKLIAGALVALPFASRFIPGFPTDELAHILNMLLGA
jgi:hypothetical protein